MVFFFTSPLFYLWSNFFFYLHVCLICGFFCRNMNKYIICFFFLHRNPVAEIVQSLEISQRSGLTRFCFACPTVEYFFFSNSDGFIFFLLLSLSFTFCDRLQRWCNTMLLILNPMPLSWRNDGKKTLYRKSSAAECIGNRM